MSAYVRVRKHDELRRHIDATGHTQTDIAAAAHLSVQRLNQIYVGHHSVLEVRKAGRLEDVLKVPRGTLFTAVDGPLLVPYIDDGPTPPDQGPHRTYDVTDSRAGEPPLANWSTRDIVAYAA